MFEPGNRQLLHDVFRPPAGFRLDRAISTTYSLDLTMLMTLPVAFSMFDRSTAIHRTATVDRSAVVNRSAATRRSKRPDDPAAIHRTMNSNNPSTGNRQPDPLALLQAIRQYAGRMHFFCQSGRISVPKRHHTLFAHLEDVITEVNPPGDQGVFHPKMTLLRFAADTRTLPDDHQDFEEHKSDVRYRLLCSSRNLTFDRSWDTMLTLDGSLPSPKGHSQQKNKLASGQKNEQRNPSNELSNPHERKTLREQNLPLARFVASLPELALRSASSGTTAACREMSEDLQHVKFILPDGFEELSFHPIGIPGYNEWPFPEQPDRLLVISPFLTDGLLRRFRTRSSRRILVSRHEALDELDPDTLNAFENYFLHDAAEEPVLQADDGSADGMDDDTMSSSGQTDESNMTSEPDIEVESNAPDDSGPAVKPEQKTRQELGDEHKQGDEVEQTEKQKLPDEHEQDTETLSGLHAKIFVADQGTNTHIWTGSANATTAAFEHNVEFLVRLRGPRHRFGVNKLVRPEHRRNDKDDSTSAVHFDDLLEPYSPPDEKPEEAADEQEAERLSDQTRRSLAHAGMVLQVEKYDGQDNDQRETRDGNTSPDRQKSQNMLESQDTMKSQERQESQYKQGSKDRQDSHDRQESEALYHLFLTATESPEGDNPLWDEKVTVRCRPTDLSPQQTVKLDPRPANIAAAFAPLTLKALTSFMAFHVEARYGKAVHRTSFVLNLPLLNAPTDRHKHLLAAMLENREKLIRYLLMLLAVDEYDFRTMNELIDHAGEFLTDSNDRQQDSGLPLLEPILTVLERYPEKLEPMQRLVDDLSRDENGRKLLPDGFAELWQVIQDVRE